MVPTSKLVLNPQDLENKVRRLAMEIIERHPAGDFYLVGIHTRGVILAKRLHAELKTRFPKLAPLGTLDVGMHRDDLGNRAKVTELKGTELPFEVDNARVVLVDDVLFTGRSTKAAIDALMDYGRPRLIELAVLIDRGNRELPITANYVGAELETRRAEYIRVRLRELDGEDGIYLVSEATNAAA